MSRNIMMIIIAALLTVLSAGVTLADDSALWTTSTTPDALILLDNSGSMAELPNGTTPTMYICGTTNCNSYSGPYYASPPTTSNVLGATSFYVGGTSCTVDGPYTLNTPGLLPNGNLYVVGSSSVCTTSNGPYLTTSATRTNPLNYNGTNVYATSTCNAPGPYYTTTASGRTKTCATSTYIPDTSYVASDCTNGPFYTTTATGRTMACTRYTLCTTPFSNISSGGSVYTETDCSTGNFYRTTGTGHTTACWKSDTTCSTANSNNPFSSSLTAYSASGDCNQTSSGPFYKTSGTGHTTVCQYCSQTCTPSSSGIPWGDTTCVGPFYSSSGTGHTTNCSKIEIAKRSIFALMDNDNDGTITSADVTSLGIRLGYMRYYSCNSADNDSSSTPWLNGCEKLIWGITQSDNTTTTPYANIYCNNTTCASTVTSCSGSNPCVVGSTSSGGTPLADALHEAKLYLDWHKALDPSASCRQKSIIVITDGADTYSCSGDGSNTNLAQRISPIYYTNQAKKANYSVYVVGFGATMPQSLQNTLNWMAFEGGTRNPNTTQSGSTTAVTVSTGANACAGTTDPQNNNLSGYAFLASDPDTLVNSLRTAITSIEQATYSFSSQASVAAARVQQENFIYEASFEPQNTAGANKEPFWVGHLKKYNLNPNTGGLITPPDWDAGAILQNTAYTARNMWTLKNGIMTLFNTSNITDADLGIGTSTTTCGTQTGTCITGCSCTAVVGFYQGNPTYNLEGWKLGDLYHTNPVVVNTPSTYFYDPRECGSTSFAQFRSNNTRTAANGNQIIVAGANDGQFHAFRTGSGSDYSAGGDEVWSFIPPNFLQKIAPIAHNDHSNRASLGSHDLFVDGPIQVADAWLPATAGTGTSKSASDWKTLALFGEASGSGNYLWSASSNCYSSSTSGFSGTYSATTPYYCGFYALNVTNTTSAPIFLWTPKPTAGQAIYMGQAWSKMQVGRVKIGGNEKWVGLIGAGYDASSCLSADGSTSTACNSVATGSPGKGFFVVDLKDGTILWSFTPANNANMQFSIPAAPFAYDLDNDGFIDTVYMGDLGGNVWRFRFCTKDACSYCGKSDYTTGCTSCGTANWKGSLFFSSTNTERGSGLSTPVNTHKQIFTKVTGDKDANGNLWIYFGTGENNDPTSRPTDTSDTKNRLFGIQEVDLNAYDTGGLTYPTFSVAGTPLTNVTSSFNSSTCSATTGWYYNLSTNSRTRSDGTVISNPVGEKMISDPAISNQIVYFSTYVPDQGTGTACGLAGDSFLVKVNYLTGCGACAGCTATGCTAGATCINNCSGCTSSDSTNYIGHGIGSSVLVSWRPGLTGQDIYATASGGAGTAALTQELTSNPGVSSVNNVLYWRDKRLQ